MNHQELVATIARRLPDHSKGDVAEVLEVMVDVCIEHLSHPGQVVQITDLGRLSIDVHRLQVAGAVRKTLIEYRGAGQPETLKRIVGRFRPAPRLRQAIESAIKEEVN
ncbi:MAG: HU family DNA-binding protein [Chloroflexi bacterium]|nr:HU family DNA-binding protein [Chloroflexota bacterium]